ncbi:MAG: PilZ domain-containing protein [Bradymonadaceae bacterium]
MNPEDEELKETDLFGEADEVTDDSREHSRVAMLSNVRVRIPTEASQSQSGGRSDNRAELVRGSRSGDVSRGGMYLESTEPVAEGTSVTVNFTLPDSEGEVEIPAEIRWVRKPGEASAQSPWKFGIQFVDLSDRQQELLEEFVERRAL